MSVWTCVGIQGVVQSHAQCSQHSLLIHCDHDQDEVEAEWSGTLSEGTGKIII